MSSTVELEEKLKDYGQWREQLIQGMDRYQSWLESNQLLTDQVRETLQGMAESLRTERLVVAFAAEFSRGKTELINSLFFSDTGVRLLPSSPGRTTMCPTEIFWDAEGGSYIRVLSIETRLSDATLAEYKHRPASWLEIELDHNSPVQMQEAFQELAATKKVPLEEARRLGLYSEDLHPGQSLPPEMVEIPCWRHALISFPHHLLKQGLCILDTPGLNALGTEPELTLNMLPGAQAVVFVLAADTGVTKSDLDMWQNHVRGSRHNHPGGLAVVMNKIDSMWGDLQGEEAIEKSLATQIASTAKILEVDEHSIFPISAKQALLAKVKGDEALLERSRLKTVEDYLANQVVKSRKQILHDAVARHVGQLVDQSATVIEDEMIDAKRQLLDMRKIDVKNQTMTRKLMEETRDQQAHYLSSVDSFQASRRVFIVQVKLLVEALSSDAIDPLVRAKRKEMAGSLTTMGMKAAMRNILDELRLILEKAAAIAEENRRLVKAIYGRFQDEHGFTDIAPVLFSFKKYERELDRIFQEGEDFRNSTASTLMEQSLVVQKLYGTIIANARELFAQAHRDAKGWSAAALAPLIHKIKDHKRVIESRLEVLRKVNESAESLDSEIAELERKLEPLEAQYRELTEIRRMLDMEGHATPFGQTRRNEPKAA
ncbi:dynamin family protein [Methylococcus sp. EFPC2]|uniref:dynamin family protein n=1 Tax=Methylococcus sp. EFPC2 TaxID=2812648 RepID=UPI0019679770|nr:dynamin family protein [Methylococcus sp. EFPC2]QSA96155.1 dynamin family protein [Methylococcus sp. EFPC2]